MSPSSPKNPPARRRLGPLCLATVALATACTAASPPSSPIPSDGPGTRTPALDHIAIVVFENKEYDEVIGNESMPFLNQLATRYSQVDRVFGITHPSLPNYIAMLSGDTQGITSNCTDCFIDAPNLIDQLEAAGISWGAYMQGMPSACYVEDSGSYAVRHNPFVYFDSIREDPERCAKVVPLEELGTDLDAQTLPRFIWITPDLCASMHDCDEAEGDAFLEDVVPVLIEAMGERSIIVVTFDEGASDEGCCGTAEGGHIATVVAGSAARPAANSDQPSSLYSILRTVEEGFGLPLLGNAGCDCTPSLGSLITAS